MCHPFAMLRAGSEAKPKDLANEREILRFAQNDSLAVTLVHVRHLTLLKSLLLCPGYNFILQLATHINEVIAISCYSYNQVAVLVGILLGFA
jgi:D-arabinose 5-phosphate isomerase GutQ